MTFKGGMTFSKLMGVSGQALKPDDISLTDLKTLKSLYLNKNVSGYSISCRLNYQLSRLIILGIEPQYKRMGSITNDSFAVKTKPYTFGMNTGIYFRLF